jgi:dipeptidyl aminopeptidase/acylaminoacyl peptidase
MRMTLLRGISSALFLLTASPLFRIPAFGSDERLTVEKAIALDAEYSATGFGRVQYEWIPGSHQIVYSRADNSRGIAAQSIYVINVETGRSLRILEGSNPVPSPNGKELAFLRSANNKTGEHNIQIWLSRIDGSAASAVSTEEDGCEARIFSWSPDSTKLLYWCEKSLKHSDPLVDLGGGASVEVYPTPASREAERDLHIYDLHRQNDRLLVKHKGQLGRIGWLDPHTAFYEHDNEKPIQEIMSDISALSVDTGNEYPLVAGLQRQTAYSSVPSPARDKIAFFANPDAASFSWYPSPTALAVMDLRSHKTVYITKYESWIGEEFTWSADGKWVVYGAGSFTKTNLFASGVDGRTIELTTGTGTDQAPSISSDGQYIVWTYIEPDYTHSLKVARWNDAHLEGTHELLRLDGPVVRGNAGTFSAIQWKSSDGLTVDGFLILPVGYRVGIQYPTVVIVHGGPNADDLGECIPGSWPGGFYFLQLLAERGYVVFVPDYRASQHLGIDKMLAVRARDQLLQADFEDIMSGVRTLERQGIADPQRLAVLGHSYGSDEVNWIITHSTDFAAAVSKEGSDPLLDWGTKYGPNTSISWYLRGSPLDRPIVFHYNSAFTFAKGVRTPTLFVKTMDPAVGLEWLYAALLDQGIDTQFLKYHDESHVLTKRQSQVDLLQRILDWLSRHGVK